MKQIIFKFIFLIGVTGSTLYAQSPVDNYIKEGLKNNLVLKQKNIAIDRALSALRESKALFMPSVNFSSTYQSGEGGRYFDFPVGDFITPVYQTLNQLTGTNNFPQLQKIKSNLNPNNYYDAHIRTSLPIVNPDIYYNYKIQQQQVTLSEKQVALYQRELVKDIKAAYYNYLMAKSGAEVYESALKLVEKNLKVNQSLFNNGSGLIANVNRAKAEIEEINSQLLNAQNQQKNAQYYFNFLLNKGLEDEIILPEQLDDELQNSLALSSEAKTREELDLLNLEINVNETVLKMNQKYWIPKISAFIDLGSQASDWAFDSQSRYYFAGIQMDFPIFNGFKNSTKIQQKKLDLENLNINKDNITKQLQMSAKIARNDQETASKKFTAAAARIKAAESYYKVIERGYNEGVNSLIEYIDARNQLTASQLQHTIAKYQLLIAGATLERETASYIIKK